MSAYRAELTGIFSTVWLVNQLCTYFHINNGQIDFRCDGISALHSAFNSEIPIQPNIHSYDLIAAIRRELQKSPIIWNTQHIEGHQDDQTNISQLVKAGQLNVEADLLAKSMIPIAKAQPRHLKIPSEPWSVWQGNKKNQTFLQRYLQHSTCATGKRVLETER
jgi:hypothetical protein